MLGKGFTVLIISVGIVLILFFAWHYFLSIYEVKVKSSTNLKIIKPNSSLILEVVAINAFGWELTFREIKVDLEISKGEDNIYYKFRDSHKIEITTLKKGEVVLNINPEYSLRPIVLTFKIDE